MIKYGDGVVSPLNREPLVHSFQAIAGDGHIHPKFRELPDKTAGQAVNHTATDRIQNMLLRWGNLLFKNLL